MFLYTKSSTKLTVGGGGLGGYEMVNTKHKETE